MRVKGLAADYGLTRTAMTMNPIRCLFQPPTQQTCHSPKREPSVTAVRKRRNFVSNCMCFYGHPMSPFVRQAQSSRWLSPFFEETVIHVWSRSTCT